MKKLLEEIKKHPLGWIVAGIGFLGILIGWIAAIVTKEWVAFSILTGALAAYGYFVRRATR